MGMHSEDLQLEELVEFRNGEINLLGRRLVLHSVDAFSQFRHDLIEHEGLEEARRILFRFGYFWGQADAAALQRVFDWENTEEWLKAGSRMHALQGVVQSRIVTMKLGAENRHLEMQVDWPNSGEANEHLYTLGTTNHPVCWMLAGYMSGYASFCLDRPVYFIEQQCRAKGDPICTATGKDVESWGPEIESYVSLLQGESIHEKVKRLTLDLQQKTQQLAEERRKRIEMEHKTTGRYSEIRSHKFRQVLERARRVSKYQSSIILTGESGAGKEVLARHIHHLSNRSDKPFVPVNCAALPESLLESELFGHTKGAFTGATQEKSGVFEQADGGTLFLDEITEITPAVQIKLLRALERHEIRKVGGEGITKVDVRIIAATNADIPAAIKSGTFREDLYYRLAVVEIHVPPLRERPEDILPLARTFLRQFAKEQGIGNLRLGSATLNVLLNYSWPGNVRELKNCIERAVIFAEDNIIRPEDLPPKVLRLNTGKASAPDPSQSLEVVERNHIHRVLDYTKGNKTAAAKILGIDPSTLWRKLDRWEKKDKED